MDSTIVVAIIGAVGIIAAAVVSSKWTKQKTENVFLVEVQKTYQGLINDLQATNTRLIVEREGEVKRREELEEQLDDLRDKMQIIMAKLGIVEPQRCLMEKCERRVYP